MFLSWLSVLWMVMCDMLKLLVSLCLVGRVVWVGNLLLVIVVCRFCLICLWSGVLEVLFMDLKIFNEVFLFMFCVWVYLSGC